MNGSQQSIIVYGQESVGPWAAVPAGASKTARINKQNRAESMVEGLMGMAVYDAVRFTETGNKRIFHTIPDSMAVIQSECVIIDGKHPGVGKHVFRRRIAHISVNRIDAFVSENFKNCPVREIARMNNSIARRKGAIHLRLK